MSPPLLRLEKLAKRYGTFSVFADLSLDMRAGEVVALIGESGVGKSTLLNGIGGLDTLQAGQVWLDGREVTAMGEHEAAHLRRTHLGFVFQAFHVLPHLDVTDNVALPLLLQRRPDAARVQDVLAQVGLAALASRHPRELSGGQLQRVAIARALVHRPRLVLADEPTGNLDPDTADRVIDLLVAQARSQAAACLIVTHSRAAASRADRVLRLTSAGITTA